MTTKLILDVDTGTDDAVALMLAALHPETELVAATTVTGNVLVDVTTENTLRVLDLIGSRVPVHRGLATPFARDDLPVPRSTPPPGKTYVHGSYLALPESTSGIAGESAVEFLIETYRAATDEIVLVPTGPLTNIAAALTVEPRLAELIPRTVIMGGAHRTGNITPRAEFNIFADPEAARVVFRAGLRDVTLVTLDSTHEAVITSEDCVRLRELGTPAADAAAAIIEQRIAGYDARLDVPRGVAPVHDAVCVAYLVDPDVLTREHLFVDVETRGELSVGETVIDVDDRLKREPNTFVSLASDGRRFARILIDAFS